MLTYEEAREKVKANLDALYHRPSPYGSDNNEYVIMDNRSIQESFGWVFYHQSKRYLEGDLMAAYVGNSPIIVNKYTGELVKTGTADSNGVIRKYKEAFETGKPFNRF